MKACQVVFKLIYMTKKNEKPLHIPLDTYENFLRIRVHVQTMWVGVCWGLIIPVSRSIMSIRINGVWGVNGFSFVYMSSSLSKIIKSRFPIDLKLDL